MGVWAATILCLAAVGSVAGCRGAAHDDPDVVCRERAPASVDPIGWPNWRGPAMTGVAPCGSPSTAFGPDEGFRWRVRVPGEGSSSPVVWGDNVVLTTALGDTEPSRLAVLCFHRHDGRLLWQAAAGQAIGPTHNKNGYASATVATDGQRIYAFFGSTGLFCYDFAGKQLWRAELGNLRHRWGSAASPLLYRDRVVQLCDSEAESYLAAFDAQTGKPLWKTPRASSGCWTTPVVATADRGGGSRDELVVSGTCGSDPQSRAIIAYRPDDGVELWRLSGTTEFVTPTAIVAGGLVYCMSGRNGPIFAIRPGGEGNIADTHVAWQLPRGGPYIPSGVVVDGRLYVLGDGGNLTAYNAATGDVVWKDRLRGSFTASLVAAGGRLFAVDEQGTVSVFAAGDRFSLLARIALDQHVLATPAIAGGEMLLRTESRLYCIPAESPEKP